MILNSSCGGFDCSLHVAHFKMIELFSERNSNGKIQPNRPVGKVEVEPCVKIQYNLSKNLRVQCIDFLVKVQELCFLAS